MSIGTIRPLLAALVASLLFGLLPGCPAPSTECTGCTASQFCCLGVCTPLGASCGGPDAGPLDASRPDAVQDGGMPDAPDRCALPAGATSVATVCVGDTRTSCSSAEERSCLVNDRVCIDWIDETGVAHASCVLRSETEPCDPASEVPRCEGTTIATCLARGAGPRGEPQPAGFVFTTDCEDHAPDAVCRLSGSRPVCFSPTDVSCDPDAHVATCAAYCAIAPVTELSGVIRPYPCGAGERCVLTEWSFDRPACVPLGATESPGPNQDLSCTGADAVHVRRYGYEFDESCSERLLGDTARCFDPPPSDVPPQCIGTSTETCDPSTYVAACTDANHSRYCTGSWLVSVVTCPALDGDPFLPGPCVATGRCAVGADCDPATFVPYCATSNYRIICQPGGLTVAIGPASCS